jgi:hypothetical protein
LRAGLGGLTQAAREFFINAAKATVGKDGDYVSGMQVGYHGVDDSVSVFENLDAAAGLADLGG